MSNVAVSANETTVCKKNNKGVITMFNVAQLKKHVLSFATAKILLKLLEAIGLILLLFVLFSLSNKAL